MIHHHDQRSSNEGRQRWLAFLALTLSVVLLAVEIWKAPIVLLISSAAMAITVWRSQIATARPRRRDDPIVSREAQLGALLLCGLWIGVFLVFWLADSGVDSTLGASVPIRFDGETVSAGTLLVHGLISTAAATMLTVGLSISRIRRRRHQRTAAPNGKT